MAKRGRPSLADLSVVPVNFGADRRPPPTPELTEKQADIWRAVVASEPAAYFDSAALRDLLSDYCRHRESANMISEVIEQFKAEWLRNAEGSKRYKGLLQMRDAEVRACANLATKLRLTNQSRYTPKAAGTQTRNEGGGPKPWDE